MAGAPKGNRNSANGKAVGDMLRKIAIQNPQKLRKACEAVLDKAAEGDLAAFNALADRLDGRATQALEVTAKNESNPSRNLDDTELAGIVSSSSGSGTTSEADSEDKPGGLH